MPTKKQRRRRAKEQRHEYVWVDDAGNEVEPDGAPAASKNAATAKTAARAGRVPDAPTWARSVKRGLIFAPIMFGTVLLLSPKLSIGAKISQTLFIVAVFIPFSYFLDRLFYRSYLRRSARGARDDRRRGS